MSTPRTILALALLVGCCPRAGHRGITPDGCALQSEQTCRRECRELPAHWEGDPPAQWFAGFAAHDWCACAAEDGGSAIKRRGVSDVEIERAIAAAREHHDAD